MVFAPPRAAGQHRARDRAQARTIAIADRGRHRPWRGQRGREVCFRDRRGCDRATPSPAATSRTCGSGSCTPGRAIRSPNFGTTSDVGVDVPLRFVRRGRCGGPGKTWLVHGSMPADAGVVVVDQGAIGCAARTRPTRFLEPIRKAFARPTSAALFSANSGRVQRGGVSTPTWAWRRDNRVRACEGERLPVLDYRPGQEHRRGARDAVTGRPVLRRRRYTRGRSSSGCDRPGLPPLGQPSRRSRAGRQRLKLTATWVTGWSRARRPTWPHLADVKPPRTARPPRGRGQVRDRDRAPPGGHGAPTGSSTSGRGRARRRSGRVRGSPAVVRATPHRSTCVSTSRHRTHDCSDMSRS